MSNQIPHIPPSKHQLKAIAMYETWIQNNTGLDEAVRWLFDNNWYFQTEPGAYPNTKVGRMPMSLTVNIFQNLPVSTLDRFDILDTYISFRTSSMRQARQPAVLLKHGGGPEANDWPNDVIKREIKWGRPHYQAINKKVINK
jgi:hypothetical protein